MRPGTLGILQARVSSKRLPGKVLLPILGRPMLALHLERVQRARTLTQLVVATSVDASDDPIEELCSGEGVACFRGSLDDVLDRYHSAVTRYAPEHVVRLTGDCPLADPEIIDAVVLFHRTGGFDYTSSDLDPTFPDGLDVEVVRASVLDAAWREARLRSEREHVTLWVYSRPDRFRMGSFREHEDLSWMRWTVDEPEDYAFVSRVFERLYAKNPGFGMADVLALLEREPGLGAINQGIRRNEGLARSLREDRRGAEG